MKLKLTLLAVIVFAINSTYGQGCSDAGICTAGALHAEAGEQEYKNSIQFYTIYGLGDGLTSILTPQVDINIGVSKKGFIQLRLPYVFTFGSLGSANGIGDPLLNYNHSLYKKDSFELRATIGGRFASNNASFSNDTGRALPMPYQSSLGTNDMLLGISATYKKWNFIVGYQQPLAQNNENGFFPTTAENDSDYFASNKLTRAADVVARAERRFKYRKLQWSVGLLSIYHIANDEILNPITEERVEVPNSQGLTLNCVFSSKYPIKENLSFNATLGFPLVVRENRPDGLTRGLVFSPSIQWFF